MPGNPAQPALLDGGPLPELDVTSLVDCLVRAARVRPQTDLTYVGEDGSPVTQTYAELLDYACRVLGGLRRAGLRPGTKVLLQSTDEADLLTGFWACLLGGYVPVPVSAHPPDGGGRTAVDLLTDAWVSISEAWILAGGDWHDEAVAPADAPCWRDRLLGDIRALGAGEPDLDWHRGEQHDLAVLLLTSGSTGRQKAVMLSHRNILSRCAGTAMVRGLTTASRSVNWMPLDHVGGLIMIHVRDVFVGCDQVHAKTRWVLADPLRWLELVDRYRATTTWAPNFAYGLVNDNADRLAARSWDLSCLRYLMNGGEAVRPRVIRRFLSLLSGFGLPGDSMYPGWGMSETSSGVVDCRFSLDGGSDDDRFTPVGRPHPGVTVRLVDDDVRIVATGVTGHVEVSGAPVTSGYYDNPGQNQRSFTRDGWFRTGDLAFVEHGNLTVTGRAGDVLSIGGTDYHADEIESAIEELGFVEPSYTVCCLADGDGPETIAVFCHLRGRTSETRATEEILGLISDRFGIASCHVFPVPKERIPKTGIGKLKRAQLRGLPSAGSAPDS